MDLNVCFFSLTIFTFLMTKRKTFLLKIVDIKAAFSYKPQQILNIPFTLAGCSSRTMAASWIFIQFVYNKYRYHI